MITPYTPENKVSLGLQYEFQLSSGASVTPRIDASYADDVHSNPANAPTNLIEGYTVVNGNVTSRTTNDIWRVALENPKGTLARHEAAGVVSRMGAPRPRGSQAVSKRGDEASGARRANSRSLGESAGPAQDRLGLAVGWRWSDSVRGPAAARDLSAANTV